MLQSQEELSSLGQVSSLYWTHYGCTEKAHDKCMLNGNLEKISWIRANNWIGPPSFPEAFIIIWLWGNNFLPQFPYLKVRELDQMGRHFLLRCFKTLKSHTWGGPGVAWGEMQTGLQKIFSAHRNADQRLSLLRRTQNVNAPLKRCNQDLELTAMLFIIFQS